MADLKGIKKEILLDAAKIYYARKLSQTKEKIQDKLKQENDELSIVETTDNKQMTEKLKHSIEKNKKYLKTIIKAEQNPNILDGDALAIMLLTGVNLGLIGIGIATGSFGGAVLGGVAGGLGIYGLYKGERYLGKKLKGWRLESQRHALAAKGIKTWRKKK